MYSLVHIGTYCTHRCSQGHTDKSHRSTSTHTPTFTLLFLSKQPRAQWTSMSAVWADILSHRVCVCVETVHTYKHTIQCLFVVRRGFKIFNSGKYRWSLSVSNLVLIERGGWGHNEKQETRQCLEELILITLWDEEHALHWDRQVYLWLGGFGTRGWEEEEAGGRAGCVPGLPPLPETL